MPRIILPTVPMPVARQAWRKYTLELLGKLHELHTSADIRKWCDGAPLMMKINQYLSGYGVTATIDMTNREMVFWAPDGSKLDRFRIGYALYRTAVRDQSEIAIPVYWEV